MKYSLRKIKWVSLLGGATKIGYVGDYELFEIFRNGLDVEFTLETAIYTSLEKSAYSFLTFAECEQYAYLLLDKLVKNLIIQEEKIERIPLKCLKKNQTL